jgi:hypothetical protein
MSVFTRFKKILTWTIMSITVSTVAVVTPTAASEDRAFGFRVAKAQQQKAKGIERQLACLARNVFRHAYCKKSVPIERGLPTNQS